MSTHRNPNRLIYWLTFVTLLWSGPWVWAGTAPAVVTTLRPLHSLVAGVMAGVGEPYLLIQSGVSPHRYALRPSAMRALHGADLIFWIGEEMETFLHKTLTSLPQTAVVVSLADVPGQVRHPNREGGVWSDHTESDEGHGDDSDMHLWLNPINARRWVETIRDRLVMADPENAAIYRHNAAQMQKRLDRLDRQLARQLAPLTDIPYVVFHDAYQYFEQRYGLRPVGSVSVSSGRMRGAKRLQEVRQVIRDRKAVCIFTEPQFKPRLVTVVTRGTPVKIAVLDPLGGEYIPGPELYFELMHGLGSGLTRCLEKSPQ